MINYFFFSSRRRHTRYIGDWSSDVCSSDLNIDARIVSTTTAEVLGVATGYGESKRSGTSLIGGASVGGVGAAGGFSMGSRSEERRVGKECSARCAAED